MPAPFAVRSVRPNNGIRQVHLSLDLGQPNDFWLNVTPEVLAAIFGDDEVREGDVWTLEGRLLRRAGTNGLNKA
jgi:hypothetical protein